MFWKLIQPLRNVKFSTHQQFKPLYKFELIETVATISKLKIYQTILTPLSITIVGYLNNLNYCTEDVIAFTGTIGLGLLIPLWTIGLLSNKLVGLIYLNENTNTLRIAYLDMWGRKINKEILLNDVIPLSEIPSSFTDNVYLKLRQYSTKDKMKISLKYSKILDENKFKKIFQ